MKINQSTANNNCNVAVMLTIIIYYIYIYILGMYLLHTINTLIPTIMLTV